MQGSAIIGLSAAIVVSLTAADGPAARGAGGPPAQPAAADHAALFGLSRNPARWALS